MQLGAFFLLGCRAGLGRILGGFILMLVGLLAVQLAVNVLKDTPGKRIIKQIPQYILFGVGVGGVSGLLRSRFVPGLRLRFIPRVPGGAGRRLTIRLCRSPGFLCLLYTSDAADD